MPTPTFQQILDRIGLLVGGTQPDPGGSPNFFSGARVGDSTGVAGLKGCYSIPPETLPDAPVALLLPEDFTAMGPAHAGQLMQGNEDNEDNVRIWLLVWRNDLPTQYANLVPFRDSIPALFRQHMQLSQLGGAGQIIDAFITHGQTGLLKWEADTYMGWDFNLRVRQLYSVTYADN